MSSLIAKAVFTPRSASSGQFVSTKIVPSVIAGVTAACGLIVDEAKSLCPVDTGALQESISASVVTTAKTVVGTVVAAEYYAGYVEFGTGAAGAASPGAGPYPYRMDWPGMPAQPYLRPALDTTREAVKSLMASQISIGLKL